MPSAGLQIFGAGLRLQPTTPGVSDQGNFNITGKGVTKNGIEPVIPTPWAPIPTLGTSAISIGSSPTYIGGGSTNNSGAGDIIIGRANNIRMNPNGNADGNRIVIGDQTNTYGAYGITIGLQAINGAASGWPSSKATNVVIGYAAQGRIQEALGVDGTVAIGKLSGDVIDTANGSICVGHQAKSNNATGNNVVIAKNYTITGTNSILMALGGAGLTLATDNTILIGDASHTKITIGPWDFSNGIAASASNVADVNFAVTKQIGTVNYTSITAPRVVNLPAANTVPNGFRVLVSDSSGSVTGVNTLSITRAGADTINGVAGPSLVNVAYGCKELICDGVSKWTIIRSI